MDMDSSGASTCWLYDYCFDTPVAGPDFMVADSAAFTWLPQTQSTQTHIFKDPSNISFDMEYSLDSTVMENGPSKRFDMECSLDSTVLENGPSKRLKAESYASGSKACREKLRRDKLNERFLELSSILEPGRQPKTDKVAILSDAVHMVTNLRNEAQKLKEMNDELLDKIKELKAEKNELRDEKNKLKADKEKLEQQIKLTNVQASKESHKLMPFIGYPGIAMWQFMPPAAVDTSKDHLLRPPVA